MSTKGLFFLQMAAAMTSVDDVYNPYHQERVRRENEEHRKRKEANMKPIAYLRHEATKMDISVYKKINRFQRFMIQICFGLKYIEI